MDGKTRARYLLIVFNLFFVLTGIIIISVGASVKAYFNEHVTLIGSRYLYASDLLIIIGVTIFLISFFGCCGALKENVCMTTTFSTLLIVICILELLVGIGGFLLKRQTNDILTDALDKTINEYDNPKYNETTKLWDAIQSNFQCCGVQNYTDWYNLKNHTATTLPLSCCEVPPGTMNTFTCNSENAFTEGCLKKFGEYIEGHAVTVEGVGFTFAVLQLFGILLSCYLSKQIRSDYETV